MRSILPLLLTGALSATELTCHLLTDYHHPHDEVHQHVQYRSVQLAFTDAAADDAATADDVPLRIDDAQRHQAVYGFGTSFDRSSMANLLRMSPAVREQVLRGLFDPDAEEGVRLNIIRYPLGTSDFTGTEWYTYDDRPKGEVDPELAHFSIQRDHDEGYVALLQEVLAINPGIKLVGATWSPPAWMKKRERLVRGSDLKPEYRPVFAAYLRKAMQAFAADGVVFDSISLQNEPEINQVYPSCTMSTESILAVQAAVHQEFSQHGIATRLLVGDSQWNKADRFHFPQAKQAAERDNPYVMGAAWHFYGGSPRVMANYLERYPDHVNILSEVQMAIRHDGRGKIPDALEYFQYGAHGMIDWVTGLDSTGGPLNPGNPWDMSGGRFLTMQQADPDQWVWGRNYHQYRSLSGHIRPGAVRIESPRRVKHLRTAAFQNPDGTIVVVLATHTRAETAPATSVVVQWRDQQCRLELPEEHCIASCVWSPE